MTINPNEEHPDEWYDSPSEADLEVLASTPPTLEPPLIAPQFSKFPDEERRSTRTGAEARRTSRRGGAGFWLATLAVIGIVLALVVLALFLPPLSLYDSLTGDEEGSQTVNKPSSNPFESAGIALHTLSAESPRVEVEGLALEAAPDQLSDSFGVYVVAVPPSDYLAGRTPDVGWHCAAETLPDLPGAMASSVYSLTQSGTPPVMLALQITPLPDSEGEPVDLYAWNAETMSWQFVPGQHDQQAALSYVPRCVALFQAPDSARQVGLSVAPSDTFTPTVIEANPRVYPAGMRPIYPNPSSQYPTALMGVLPPGVETGAGYDVLPLIQNFDDPAVIDLATIQQILGNPALRSDHAQQIAAFVLREGSGYAGVALDYRAIPVELRDDYTAFLRELADLLHRWDATLTVVLPTPTYDPSAQTWRTGGYDWQAIGRIADEVVIMMPLNPLAYDPEGTVDQLLTWAVQQIERSKLRIGLCAYSVADEGDGVMTPVKLQDALGYLGTVQIDPAGAVAPGQTVTAVLAGPPGIQPQIIREEVIPVAAVQYTDANAAPLLTVWITSPAALRYRMEFATRYHLGGVFVRDLMAAGSLPGLEAALLDYRLGESAELDTPPLALEWVVRDGETILQTQPGELGQPFTFEIPDGPPLLTVEARLNGMTFSSATLQIGGAAAVEPAPAETTPAAPTETPSAVPLGQVTPAPDASPTPAPTIEATATPTGEAQAAPGAALEATEPVEAATVPPGEASVTPGAETPAALTVVPVTPIPTVLYTTPVAMNETPAATPAETAVPTIDPAAAAAVNALVVPTVDPALLAGVTPTAGVEVGAHAGDFTPTVILTMGRTHFQWVRFAVQFRPGMEPGDELKEQIATAQGNGFKVLVALDGDPADLAADPVGYLEQAAAFAGALGSLKVDGVEVWRDMNDPARWPVELGAAGYVRLLGLVYHAVKTANPAALVITGPLRPAEPVEAFDAPAATDAYYAQLAAAGAAQYADCIGAEYTQGAISPDATSGDPRGNSPLLYLTPLVEMVWNAFSGERPVCLTRFGYLTPEGYGMPLPETHAWAQSVTLAQQGQWLAGAIQLARSGGKVRLLIVWTADVPAFEQPVEEAGYSIIRPDASCPSCDVLEPVLKPTP